MRSTWRIVREGGFAVLMVEPDTPLGAGVRRAFEEGDALLRFVVTDATPEGVRFG